MSRQIGKYFVSVTMVLAVSACGGGGGGGVSSGISPVLQADTSNGSFGTVRLSGQGIQSSFTPTSDLGLGGDPANGFLSIAWLDVTSGSSLSVGISNDFQGSTGNDSTLIVGGGTYQCESGFFGTVGRCDVSFDHSLRTVFFDNVEMIGPGGRVAIVDGALIY